MNTPTHLACAAAVSLAFVQGAQPSLAAYGRVRRGFVLACGCVALGLVSHFVLDWLPHLAWVAWIDWFKPLPYAWLIPEALFGGLIAVPALWLAGKHRRYVAVGMLAGLYPDIEKVLCVDLHIPGSFILLKWHSTYISSRHGGLPWSVLILGE